MNTPLLPLQATFQQHMLGVADATSLLAGSAERRELGLAIYANAYRQRLVDVLADASEKTMQMLPGFMSADIHRSPDRRRASATARNGKPR